MKIPDSIKKALNERAKISPNGPTNLFSLSVAEVEKAGYKELPASEQYAAGDLLSVTKARDTWILVDSEDSAKILRKISSVNKGSVIGPNTKVYRKV